MGSQTMQRWVIKANGTIECAVGRGQSVEIGRRPLRPMPEDQHKRIDVVDSTRSMSKRHALFSVTASGSAVIRDLGSTNGTYLVSSDGGLQRLEEKRDYPLEDSPVRVQLGDVPVDFVKVVDKSGEQPPVTDLFDYAKGRSGAVREMGEMSVDDILDVRAGEPTTSINSADVADRIKKLVEAQNAKTQAGSASVDNGETKAVDPSIKDFEHNAEDGAAVTSVGDRIAEKIIDTSAVNGGADAVDDGAAESAARQKEGPVSDTGETEAVPSPIDNLSLGVVGATAEAPALPRDLFQDAFTDGDVDSAAASVGLPVPSVVSPTVGDSRADMVMPANGATPAPVRPSGAHVQISDSAAGTVSADGKGTVRGQLAVSAQVSRAPGNVAEPMEALGQASAASDNRVVFVPMDQQGQQTDLTTSEEQAELSPYGRFMPPQDGRNDQQHHSGAVTDDQTEVSTPTFEPGSVFEKVSQGQFNNTAADQMVEAGGFTSAQAQRSKDFTEQFQMAKHPELQPYLAMNPNLYDDLYAWLIALGNQDVDAALERNSGYVRYCNQAGKGRQS
jgi:hypothetical protein